MSENTFIPSATPGVVVTDTDHGHHGNCGHRADYGISNAVQESSAGFRHQSDLTGRNAGSIKDLDINNAARVAQVEKSICHLGEALGTAVERNGRSAELATEKVGAAGILATEKVTAALQMSMATGFAAAQLAAAINAKDGIIDSAKNAAAAALAAAVNTAAIQAAIAECCCVTQGLIRSEAGQTRDLVTSMQTASLQAQLSDAKAALVSQQTSQGIVNQLLDKLIK